MVNLWVLIVTSKLEQLLIGSLQSVRVEYDKTHSARLKAGDRKTHTGNTDQNHLAYGSDQRNSRPKGLSNVNVCWRESTPANITKI